jgi:hypothetical protein
MAILFVGSIGLEDAETHAIPLRRTVGFIAGRSEQRFAVSSSVWVYRWTHNI